MTNTKLFFTDRAIVTSLGFEAVKGHQLEEEVCGFVVQGQFDIELVPMENKAKEDRQCRFSFNFVDGIRLLIERKLIPLAIYHTHLFASLKLSGSDVRVMTQSGLDMVIVSLASNEVRHYARNNNSFTCIETAKLNLLEAVSL